MGFTTRNVRSETEEDKQDKGSFFEKLPSVLTYPLKGNGLMMLIAGTLFFWFMRVISAFSIFGFIISFFVAGYMSAFMIKIINRSAEGEDEVPDWPDFTDVWEDVIVPYFLFAMTHLLVFLPIIIAGWFTFFRGVYISPIFYIVLFILGCFYLPMSLLAVALNLTVKAVNPIYIIPSIFKVPLEYMAACCALLLLALSQAIIETFAGSIFILGTVLNTFFALYFVIVEMRILGLIYYFNEEEFGWFGVSSDSSSNAT